MRWLTIQSDPASRPQTGPIGLHVAGAGVRMAQLCLAPSAATGAEQPDARPAIHAAFRFCWTAASGGAAPRPLYDCVRNALDAAPFTGRRVVAAIPPRLLHVRTVRVGAGQFTAVEDAARHEAEGLFPFSLNDATVNFLSAGVVEQGGERRTEVIVMASLRSQIDQFIRELDSAGLIVESLDAEPCALFRWSAGFTPPAESHSASMILDLGASQSQVIFSRGRRLTFVRTFDAGTDHIDRLVSRKLGVSPVEARLVCQRIDRLPGSGAAGKVDPIRKAMIDASRAVLDPLARLLTGCLRYHAVTFRGEAPAQLWLVGARAADASIAKLLSALLGVPVQTPDQGSHRPAGVSGEHELALAMGLGLKKLKGWWAAPNSQTLAESVPPDCEAEPEALAKTGVVHA